MTPARQLQDLGQSLWLDKITRTLLDDDTLQRYIQQLSATGLTSNPSIFEEAIGHGDAYDDAICRRAGSGFADEALFTALALEDPGRAADLLRRVFDASEGVDSWVPQDSRHLEGLAAIEQSIFTGVPVNVTLLFSREQYLGAAGACLRGIERRVLGGLDPKIASVASLFVSRWDKAIGDGAPVGLRNRLGIAIAQCTFQVYRGLLDSPRWAVLAGAAARPQRLLWAGTGTKDPQASDTLYVDALAARGTTNTMSERALLAFADHGAPRAMLPADAAQGRDMLSRFALAGIGLDALATRLQYEGEQAFAKSWRTLLPSIASWRGRHRESVA